MAVPNYTLKCTLYITVAPYRVASHYFKLPMPHLYNPGFTHVLKHTHLFSTAEQQCIMHNNNVSCTSSHVSSLRRVWLTRRLTYGLAGVVRVDFHDNEYAQCIQTPDNSCTHFNSCACVLLNFFTSPIPKRKLVFHQHDAAPPDEHNQIIPGVWLRLRWAASIFQRQSYLSCTVVLPG